MTQARREENAISYDEQFSMFFDTTHDYLITQITQNLTGNFEIGMDVSFQSYGSYLALCSTASDGNATQGFIWEVGSARSPCIIINGTVYNLRASIWTPTLNTFYNVRLSKVSGTAKMYIDTVEQSTGVTIPSITNNNHFGLGFYAHSYLPTNNTFPIRAKIKNFYIDVAGTRIFEAKAFKFDNWDTDLGGYFAAKNEVGADGRIYTDNITNFYN